MTDHEWPESPQRDLERPGGYVPLARKLFDGGDIFWPTPFQDRYSRGEAWVDLIQMAAFRDGAVVHGVRLNRGEVCGSLRWFARRWGWTVKEARGFLASCEGNSRIQARMKARTWARTPSVYLLTNYPLYNPVYDQGGTDSGADRARTGHNDEEGKKERSKEYTPEFEQFWQVYPRNANQSKQDAFKAWNARIREGHAPEELIGGAKRYARYPCEPQFRKHASTFLGPGLHFQLPWAAPAEPLSELGHDDRDFFTAPRA